MKYKSIIFALFITAHSYAACEGDTKSYPITDPGDGKEFIVTAKIYHPKLNIKVPAIFIMPPIVGETVLDRRLAERFCANGMAAYVLNAVKIIPTEEEIPNLRIHDDSYFRALTGIRAVLDTLKGDSSLNGRFGILGMSLGGMLAAYIAGTEPLISASVIIVGAGNVPGVLTKSDQELVKAQRDGRMKYFGVPDIKSYEDLLKANVTQDPIIVAHQIAPRSSYLFIANSDTTVPTQFQRELSSRIPQPLIYEMRADHFGGILRAGTIHAGKISNFFAGKLKAR